MKTILFITLLLNIFDYYNTVHLLTLGAQEINSLMNYAISYNLFFLTKLILIPFLILILIKNIKLIDNSIICKTLILINFISYSLVSLYHIYINLILL